MTASAFKVVIKQVDIDNLMMLTSKFRDLIHEIQFFSSLTESKFLPTRVDGFALSP